jgi:hypothetical protein
MSTLETNSIGKYSGNNVSIDDALNLKSYTTTQRDEVQLMLVVVEQVVIEHLGIMKHLVVVVLLKHQYN